MSSAPLKQEKPMPEFILRPVQKLPSPQQKHFFSIGDFGFVNFVYLGRQRDMSLVMGKRIVYELSKIPELQGEVLKTTEMKELAKKYKDFNNFSLSAENIIILSLWKAL